MQQEELYQNNYEKALATMPDWITTYLGIPYRHLGDDLERGIDCGNLCARVLKDQVGEDIPLKTYDVCDIVEEDWYRKTHQRWFEETFKNIENGFIEIDNLQPFDIILMSIGSSNITNHCALYIGNNKMLQTMVDHTSWIAPYGKWYKRYTVGKYRWKNLQF